VRRSVLIAQRAALVVIVVAAAFSVCLGLRPSAATTPYRYDGNWSVRDSRAGGYDSERLFELTSGTTATNEPLASHQYDDTANLARANAGLADYRSAPRAIGAADDVAAGGVRQTTVHGTERIAGAGATRGGVLNTAEIAVVRGGGTPYAQSDGAIARVLQQADGRFSVVVDGNRGLITTFQNLSQNSLDRLAKNYGWTSL
jgi:hypothetical protein